MEKPITRTEHTLDINNRELGEGLDDQSLFKYWDGDKHEQGYNLKCWFGDYEDDEEWDN